MAELADLAEIADRLGFAQSRLVRHSAEREHADAPAIDADGAGLVLFVADKVILREGGPSSAVLGPEVLALARTRNCEIFLGRVGARAIHAAALPLDLAAGFPEPEFRLADLRALALEGTLPPEEMGLLATAKSLLLWHARNGFCANCGTQTQARASGFRRECLHCGAHHFPRTDPVAIMLVTRGDACLIGRGPHFPGNMYSCLAGFVEPGETIEDAVRRETAEETGIVVGPVRYLASQPWPFPASLMIGCVGEALSEAITIDPAELADARWVSRDELRLMFEERHPEGITAPKPLAIAHHLLRAFLDGDA